MFRRLVVVQIFDLGARMGSAVAVDRAQRQAIVFSTKSFENSRQPLFPLLSIPASRSLLQLAVRRVATDRGLIIVERPRSPTFLSFFFGQLSCHSAQKEAV